MSGFFTSKETESQSRPDGKKLSCVSCGLYKRATTPRMEPLGDFKKKIMIIGEFPDRYEDEKDIPFSGRNGRLLDRWMNRFGFDLYRDCILLNAVNCTPYNAKYEVIDPKAHQIDCCRKIKVSKAIEEYQPNVIIPLGQLALVSVIGKMWKEGVGEMGRWRGFTIPDQELMAWICPMQHPVDVEHNNKDWELIWTRDLEQALNLWNVPVPEMKRPEIIYLEDDLTILDSIKAGSKVVIDIEDTGLKPYADGHEIICACVAIGPDKVYQFMTDKVKKLDPFFDLLEDNSIEKMAANLKHEDTWLSQIYGIKNIRWTNDSMLNAHQLDNRPQVSGLKFQTYINFGVSDYSSEIDPFLKAKDEDDSNSINRIKELIATEDGKMKLRRYNALDGIYEYRLLLKQMELIGPKIKEYEKDHWLYQEI